MIASHSIALLEENGIFHVIENAILIVIQITEN